MELKPVKVKMCGITRLEDYRLAVKLGADFVGFIFYEGSPRFIPAQKVAKILEADCCGGGPKRVGVFVNENPEKVRETQQMLDLDFIQLHGQESSAYVQSLNLPVWKAIPVRGRQSLNLMKEYNCGYFLLDTLHRGRFGGTGISFELKLAEEALHSGKKIIIAGGVSSQNINRIFAMGKIPYAVDISSSIEDIPGKKCREKMEVFMQNFNKLKGCDP